MDPWREVVEAAFYAAGAVFFVTATAAAVYAIKKLSRWFS